MSFIFFLLLFYQYYKRRKNHQLLWTIAILCYGIAALMEFLMNPEFLGINRIPFITFYINASLLVGLLGAGQLYLIFKTKISTIFLVFVLILLIGLVISLMLIPFPTGLSLVGELGEDIRITSNGYPYTVRIYAILLASIGGIVLLLGALYSFIRDRSRYYSLFFALGALLAMLRDVPFGFLGNELIILILFLVGFLLSVYKLKKKSKLEIVVNSKQ